MSDEQTRPFRDLLREVVQAIERFQAELASLKDTNSRLEIAVSRLQDQARTLEGEVADLRAAREAELTQRAEEAAYEREQAVQRRAWLGRLWDSTPVQLLLAGIVVAALQALGVAYVAQHYLAGVGQ